MATPNYNKLVFFDTETTSISPNYIVTLAYIAVENNKVVKRGMITCNPDYPISPQASAVNGLTNKMVADKPYFDEAWKDIQEYFENAILIAHNSNFDCKALRLEFKRYGLEFPKHWECDTLANAKRLIPKGETKNYKLATLCDYFGIDLGDAYHIADFDTEALLRVFNKLVKISNGNLEVKEG